MGGGVLRRREASRETKKGGKNSQKGIARKRVRNEYSFPVSQLSGQSHHAEYYIDKLTFLGSAAKRKMS